MSTFLGIDPGKLGAIATYDTESHGLDIYDMPKTTVELHDVIASLPNIRLCVLEKAFYPRMIGVSNCARIAEAYGILKGALIWRDIPFREVPPAKWKPAMDLTKDKTASRQMAQNMFPDQADLFKRVKDDGRAEAALIAYYASERKIRTK